MTGYHSFETDRLFLRPTHESDAEFIFELLNTPKWKQFIGDRNIHSVDDAEGYINTKMRPQLERQGYSNYTVIRKEDGAKIGTCGLYDRDGVEGIDIGFAFLPQFERHGYAFEAASRIMSAAIHIFKIPYLKGITTQDNEASQRLLEKLGLKYVKDVQLPNDDALLRLYEWHS